MDTRTPEEVKELQQIIKTKMPETYAFINIRAKEIGSSAWRWVERGLKGEPNCFYGVENGFVVGTPFNVPFAVADEQARNMVVFGRMFCSFWGDRLEPK